MTERRPLLQSQIKSSVTQRQSRSDTSQYNRYSGRRFTVFPLVLIGLLVIYTYNTLYNNDKSEPTIEETCPQYGIPNFKSTFVSGFPNETIDIKRLSEAVTFKTISYDFMRDVPPPPPSQPDDEAHLEFRRFHLFLERAYPRVHQHLELFIINR